MRQLALLIVAVMLGGCAAHGTYTNPVGATPIHMGDPFAYFHDGSYYLVGTTDAGEGFRIYKSKDLSDWTEGGWAWKSTPQSALGPPYWAPEVREYRGKFYMTYSGQSRSQRGKLMMALAVSDRAEGPFVDLHAPWFDAGYSTIDGDIFVDEDGTPWLYFSRNGARDGYAFGVIYGVQLSPDLSGIVGEPQLLMEASQPWERVKWKVNRCNEGPTVFRHAGLYYMTYSANDTSLPYYGVGYATAERPLGPWIKARENPILQSDLSVGVSGPGHNSLVRSPDGKELFMVYHTHADPTRPSSDRVVNIDRVRFEGIHMKVLGPTRTPQRLPSGAE